MINMDQTYLFELDANLSPTILIKQILERLNTFKISKANKPLRLNEVPEYSEEDLLSGGAVGETVETEEMMQTVTNLKKLSSKYKWKRSRWLRYCPVALKNGSIVEGRPEFSAA